MGYRLWYGKFEDALEYYDKDCMTGQYDMFGSEISFSATPIYLGHKSDFRLDEIDFITSGYKNEEDFAQELKKQNVDLSSVGNFFITHRYRTLIEDTVVYDSPLLKMCAKQVELKRKDGYLDSEIWLTRSDEILEFVKKIQGYLEDDKIYAELLSLDLNPNLIMGFKEYKKNSKRRINSIYEGCLKYGNLRKLVVWEKEHLAREKKKKDAIVAKRRQSIENKHEVLKALSEREKLDREPVVNRLVSKIYNTRDSDGDIDWDRVWNEYSADDVYLESNFEDLQRIGFFDESTTKESLGYGSVDGVNRVKKK